MRIENGLRRRGRGLLAVFTVLSLGITAAGRAYYLAQKASLCRRVHSELASIAHLKVSQIARWRDEELKDATEISNNPFVGAQVARWLADPSNPRLRKDTLTWMRSLLLSGKEWSAVALYDRNLNLRLAVPESYAGHAPRREYMVQRTFDFGTPSLTDLHTAHTKWGARPHFDLLVPLKARVGASSWTVAVLVIRLDAESFLYPLIQSWPTPSRTAETLLVRREDDQVLFLNELRHWKGSAFKLRTPLRGEPIPAVLAVLGREGIVEGLRDYRGVPVVAALRSVPGSSWKLVAKIDEDEAYGQLHQVALLASVVVGLLVLGAGLSVGLLWQKQTAEFQAAQAHERLQTEALRNHYNFLMHRGHDAILLLDADLTIVNANDRAAEHHGATLDGLFGRNIRNVHPPDTAASLSDRLRALEDESGVVFEMEHPRPDGGSFPAEVSARCSIVGGERYYQIIVRDITERKQAEAERARLSTAVEQAAEGMAVLAPDGQVQYVNPAFTRITGFPADEVLGCELHDLLSDGPAKEALIQALSAGQQGDIWQNRIAMPRKDGTTFECHVTVSPVKDASGRVVNLAAVLRDITLEVALEERLRESQKLDAVGRLAGGVAHEFNNLMTVVLGFGRMLASRVSGDPSLARPLEQITKAAERAAELTQQLLAFSRKQVIRPQVLDPGELILGMHGVLQRVLGENIVLLSRSAPDVWPVKADPTLIHQIIINLAANARDAMPEGGKLTIEVANTVLDDTYAPQHADVTPGPYVVISVTDTGRGMDRETLTHLFEPFYTTKGLAVASGLGLASVYGMVKQSGGHISVHSEIGKGTTFKVYLPRSAEGLAHAAGPLTSEVELGRGETVLVVEDEAMVRDLVVDVLGSHGYTVVSASTPDEAEQVCRANPGTVRLLLADVVMPRMNASQLAQRLLDLEPQIKVLYMSAYPEDAVLHSGRIGRAKHYISKPFTAQDLLKKVREALDGPAELEGSQ